MAKKPSVMAEAVRKAARDHASSLRTFAKAFGNNNGDWEIRARDTGALPPVQVLGKEVPIVELKDSDFVIKKREENHPDLLKKPEL